MQVRDAADPEAAASNSQPPPEALHAAVATAEWVGTTAPAAPGNDAETAAAVAGVYETPQHGRPGGDVAAVPASAAALQQQQQQQGEQPLPGASAPSSTLMSPV